jgi:hypothetical protein
MHAATISTLTLHCKVEYAVLGTYRFIPTFK